MTVRVAINGFGRMGRLVTRVLVDRPGVSLVSINERGCDAAVSAHLLTFDSVHGRWDRRVEAGEKHLCIDGHRVEYGMASDPCQGSWRDVDLVLECTGAFRTPETLAAYFAAGVKKVIVAAPVANGALNVVYGINHHQYEPDRHHLLTASSCTTNALAPVVQVLRDGLGIRRGSFTTIHDVTNTQVVVDHPHKDPRRARSCLMSLIPTTTGSAKAIMSIFPNLQGRLDGLAVRVPLLNASLIDAVFEVERATTVDEVNALFATASTGALVGILGYEERPLVSIDYVNDPRSGVIDALSTRVVDGTHVKVLIWYDNEWGYVHRMADLTVLVAQGLSDS